MRFLTLLQLGFVCLCGMYNHVVVLGLSEVVTVPYVGAVTVMHVLFVLHMSMVRECEGDGNAGVCDGAVW